MSRSCCARPARRQRGRTPSVPGLGPRSAGLCLALLTWLVFALTQSAAPTLASTPVFTSLMTGEATNVGPRSATLNGSFMSSGDEATTYWFEYAPCSGIVCTYERSAEVTLSKAQVEAAEAGSHDTGVSVEATVTGLQPGTYYKYRLAAKNTPVTIYAGVGAFTTGPKSPRVESEAADEVTDETALLSAAINPGNSASSGYPTTYRFDYELVGSGNVQSFAPPGVTAASGAVAIVPEALTGLAPASEYAYWLIAQNASGEVEGPMQTFTTAAAPPPPAAGAGGEGSSQSAAPTLTQPPTQPLLPVLTPVPGPRSTPVPVPKPLTRAQKLAKALGQCKKESKKRRRFCQKKARRRFDLKRAA